MRIVAARVAPLRLALRRPLVTARGAVAEREGFVLALASDDEHVGEGEGSPAYWLGEGSLNETATALARVVAACDARPTLAEARGWLEVPPFVLPPAVACALDGALLDLEARVRGVGVAALLGAPSAVRVPIAALVGGRTPDEAAAEADAALAAGFRTVKLKVGGVSLADDRARVAAVHARLPADVKLRLDANRAWSRAAAERALATMAAFAPEYVEEPLADGDPAMLAALARTVAVPLAVDESLRGADDLERLVATGARIAVVLKAARVGGPTRLVALARRAAAAGLAVTVTDAIESGVGMRQAVHAAAALAGTDGADAGAVAAVGLGGAQLLASEAALRVPVLAPVGPGTAVAADVACGPGAGGGAEGAGRPAGPYSAADAAVGRGAAVPPDAATSSRAAASGDAESDAAGQAGAAAGPRPATAPRAPRDPGDTHG